MCEDELSIDEFKNIVIGKEVLLEFNGDRDCNVISPLRFKNNFVVVDIAEYSPIYIEFENKAGRLRLSQINEIYREYISASKTQYILSCGKNEQNRMEFTVILL